VLIVLSDRDEVEEVLASFRAGARGFIPTSLDPRIVIAAIRLVVAGGAFIPVSTLLRELAVLHLLGEGKTNKCIAAALGMEESMVKVHVSHIMRKLGAKNRTQVALYVRRLGPTADAVGDAPERPPVEFADGVRVAV
jgi:DNA-binding NarL/FixJ family response regulator